MSSRLPLRPSSPVKMHTFAVGIGVLGILLIAGIIFFTKFTYPSGWDTGYYVDQLSSLEYGNTLNHRAGFIIFSLIVKVFSGQSSLVLFTLLPFFLLMLLSLMVGALVWKLTHATYAFLVAFILVLTSPAYSYFAVSLFDNLFALVLFSAILLLLTDDIILTLRGGILMAVLLFTIAFSHIEMFLFSIGTVGLYVTFISLRRLKNFWGALWNERWIILTIALAILVGYTHWRSVGVSIIEAYSKPTTFLDASIEYAHVNGNGKNSLMSSFLQYNGRFIDFSVYGILFILGFLYLPLSRRIKDRSRFAWLAWLATAYALFVFAIVRGGIPVDRALSFIPYTPLVAIGLSAMLLNLRRSVVGLCIFAFILLSTLGNFTRGVQSQTAAVPQTFFDDLKTLRQHTQQLQADGTASFIVLTNTPPDTIAANAYYSMWNYWIQATLAEFQNIQYCTYFGEAYSVLEKRYPSERAENPEYNQVSRISSSCLANLKTPREMIVIESISGLEFDLMKNNLRARKLSDRVLSVTL